MNKILKKIFKKTEITDCGNGVTPNGKSYDYAAKCVPSDSQAEEKVEENGGEQVAVVIEKSEQTTSKVVETTIADITIPTKEEYCESTINEEDEIIIEDIPYEGYVVEIIEEGGEVVDEEDFYFVDADISTIEKVRN